MSTTIELPDGEKAVLKEASDMTNREMKLLQRKIRSAATAASKMRDSGYRENDPASWATAISSLTDEEMDQIDLFQRACVIMRLESWTLDRDLPQTEDEVDDLPRAIFNPLTVAAADVTITEEFSAAGANDPKAGTARSASSRPRSKVATS